MLDDQPDVAVVDEHPVTGPGVLSQPLVGGRHPVVGALDVLDGDPHRLAVLPDGRAVGETTEPDFRSLQVGEDADGVPGAVRRHPDPLVIGLVIGVVTVAEIEPGDVHAGLDEFADRLLRGGRRSQRTDDLSASTHGCRA